MSKKVVYWVATEDAATGEVTECESADEDTVLYLMGKDGYRVTLSSPVPIRVREGGVIYKGVIYKGGWGVNIWVTRRYIERNR